MDKDERWLLEEKYRDIPSALFETDKERLAAGEPLGYVIGWQPFLNLKIYLDSHPLIPRPETEWWAEQLLNSLKDESKAHLEFLDLCAGSGAIGCAALAQLPNAHVSFGEVDPSHESTIRKNIRENNLDESRADIRIGDLFEPFAGKRFDVIATNPPYVPADRELPESVANYEPARALFAGSDGLDFMRRIAAVLPEHLTENGIAWIECDRGHAEATQELFEEKGFHAEIQNDQYDKPRIIVVTR
jgi:release factor glutamine methyltransferase